MTEEKKPDENFTDPATGELVSRIKVPDELIKDIEDHVSTNARHANEFMQFSRQMVGLQKRQIQSFDEANKEEQLIGKEVLRIRERMKLDSGWIYNIPMRMMEKREPPADTRMIGAGEKPPVGVPPPSFKK